MVFQNIFKFEKAVGPIIFHLNDPIPKRICKLALLAALTYQSKTFTFFGVYTFEGWNLGIGPN